VCLNISTIINIKILANSNQQTQSYKFTSHIAVVLITEMLEICIQIQILKSYLPVVYGTILKIFLTFDLRRNRFFFFYQLITVFLHSR